MKNIFAIILLVFTFTCNAQMESYYDSTTNLYGFKSCTIIEPEFEYVDKVGDSHFLVSSNGLFGLLDENANSVVNREFEWAVPHNLSPRIFFFDSLGVLYVFDISANQFTDTLQMVSNYDLMIDGGESYIYGNGFFRVKKNGKMVLNSLEGGTVYDLNTEYIDYLYGTTSKGKTFSYLLAGSYGSLQILNLNGKQFSKEVFTDYLGIFNGLAIVIIGGQVKFIDMSNGKLVSIPKEFVSTICINLKGFYGVIGEGGTIKIPFNYNNITHYSIGYYLVEKEGVFNGILDESGNQYLSEDDLSYKWSFVYCDKFDFFKDAHRAFDGYNGDAAYFYDSNLKKLVRKTEFEYFSIDCKSDEKGKYRLLKGGLDEQIEEFTDSSGKIEK